MAASQTAYNYFLSEASSTIVQIASAQQSAADLTSSARSIERSVLSGIASEVRSLCASEPSLERLYFAFSSEPVLQLLDSRGQETYRINLPTREAVRDNYFTYLSGSGYTPASTAEANAYYAGINHLLAARAGSGDFSLIEVYAEEAEKQVAPLLDALRVFEPPVREWFHQLVWEAGDGDDRSRELLGHSLSSLLMSREIDDYSPAGQALLTERSSARLAIPDPARVDAANCLLDEINGNIDTGLLVPQCLAITPEDIAENKESLDALLRYIPSLHSSGGVSIALARVEGEVTDPDVLVEARAELLHKGTDQDPVLLAIRRAAQDNSRRFGLPDHTALLLDVEAKAHAFLALAESLFGSKTSPYFRIVTALGPDERLSGFRRREGLVTLRELLFPKQVLAEAANVRVFLWMLGNRKIAPNRFTREVWQGYVEGMPPSDYWALQAFVDGDFISPEIVARAEEFALAQIRADLERSGTGLVAEDLEAFKDALVKLATLAVTPEDRRVQRERLRDIGQRMTYLADSVSYRYALEVAAGGGYLADQEYYDLYRALCISAARTFWEQKDPEKVKAELGAFGNLDFNGAFALSLSQALQQTSGGFFSESELNRLLGEQRLGAGAEAYDRYWKARAGPDAQIVFDTAIVLSRTLNTLSDSGERIRAVAAARNALERINFSLADPETTLALVEALLAGHKTPRASAEETEFLKNICRGNDALHRAYKNLSESVLTAFQAIDTSLPPVPLEDYLSATAVAFYPLDLFARSNEYASGITATSVNHSVQGGRVLSNLGNDYTLYEAVAVTASPYGTAYYPLGYDDVVSQVRYDPNIYTYSGEYPASYFNSGFSPGVISTPYADFIAYYEPDMRSESASDNLAFALSSASRSASAALANILCKADALIGLIQQLNGVVDPSGAVMGGINNAIRQVNDALYGMTGKLDGLIKSLGQMGSLNLGVNCKCMAFDLSVDLRKLLAPISSWLTGFGAGGLKLPNIFANLKNPFKFNANAACPQDVLGNLGSGVKFPP